MLVAAELAVARGALRRRATAQALADLIASLGPLPPIADLSVDARCSRPCSTTRRSSPAGCTSCCRPAIGATAIVDDVTEKELKAALSARGLQGGEPLSRGSVVRTAPTSRASYLEAVSAGIKPSSRLVATPAAAVDHAIAIPGHSSACRPVIARVIVAVLARGSRSCTARSSSAGLESRRATAASIRHRDGISERADVVQISARRSATAACAGGSRSDSRTGTAVCASQRSQLDDLRSGQIDQTPSRSGDAVCVALTHGTNGVHRRPRLPKDPNPDWLVCSVGRWDGDTLVVTTAGFNVRGWLGSVRDAQRIARGTDATVATRPHGVVTMCRTSKCLGRLGNTRRAAPGGEALAEPVAGAFAYNVWPTGQHHRGQSVRHRWAPPRPVRGFSVTRHGVARRERPAAPARSLVISVGL